MKIKMLLGMLCLSAVIVFAAEKPTPSQRREMSPRQIPGRPMPDMQQQYQQVMSERARMHQQQIKELQDIKKIAEEEKAEKTAAAIQAMIDKKDAEYKKSVEQFETMRKQRTEQIEQRLRQRPHPAAPEGEGTEAEAPKTESQQ